jgi:hypothetical protein
MVLTLIQKYMAFCRLISNTHVTTNLQSLLWKDENISVFDKNKPDADVAKVSINLITDLQSYSKFKSYWVECRMTCRQTWTAIITTRRVKYHY